MASLDSSPERSGRVLRYEPFISSSAPISRARVPVRPQRHSDVFRQLAKDAGVPVIKPHSLRHTLALLLIRLGVPAVDCAALLGHTPEAFLSTCPPAGGSTGTAAPAAAMGRAAVWHPPLVTPICDTRRK